MEDEVVVKLVLDVGRAGFTPHQIWTGRVSTTGEFFDMLVLDFPNILGNAFQIKKPEYALYTSCGKRLTSRSAVSDIKAANFIYVLNSRFLTSATSLQLFADV